MSEKTKNRRQNRLRHDVYDDDVFGTFCGMVFNDIRTMVLNFCMENSSRGSKNNPREA